MVAADLILGPGLAHGLANFSVLTLWTWGLAVENSGLHALAAPVYDHPMVFITKVRTKSGAAAVVPHVRGRQTIVNRIGPARADIAAPDDRNQRHTAQVPAPAVVSGPVISLREFSGTGSHVLTK